MRLITVDERQLLLAYLLGAGFGFGLGAYVMGTYAARKMRQLRQKALDGLIKRLD